MTRSENDKTQPYDPPDSVRTHARTHTHTHTHSGVVANIYLAERMASAEREPITGVWGQSPQRDPGAEPLVGGQGGEGP